VENADDLDVEALRVRSLEDREPVTFHPFTDFPDPDGGAARIPMSKRDTEAEGKDGPSEECTPQWRARRDAPYPKTQAPHVLSLAEAAFRARGRNSSCIAGKLQSV
jgi:hypothetical protein